MSNDNEKKHWIEVELNGEVRKFSSPHAAAKALNVRAGSLSSAMRGNRGFLKTHDGRKLILNYDTSDGSKPRMDDLRTLNNSFSQSRKMRIAIDDKWYDSLTEGSRATGIKLTTLSRAITRGNDKVKPRGGTGHVFRLEYDARDSQNKGLTNHS